ncbi:MAG: hypothetical protein WBX18_21225, partial [Terracidiphilus sp.]
PTTIPPAPPSQGFTPVPMAAAPPPGKSHRTLWIGLGALAAILALVASATVLPHFFATHAGQKSGSAAAGTQTASNTTPAANPAAPAAAGSQPAAQPSSPSAATPAANPATTPAPTKTGTSTAPASSGAAANSAPEPPKKVAPEPPVDEAAPAPVPVAPPAPAGPTPEELHRARNRYMDLDARADTVRSGVEQLRRQQQSQGYDMRGDMVGALNRLNNNLREADRALNDHDLEMARDYMDHANHELETLERFLGGR